MTRVARMIIHDKFSKSKLSMINCDLFENNLYVITINDSILYTNIVKHEALNFIHLACSAYECLAFAVMDEDFYDLAINYDKLNGMTIIGPEKGVVPAIFISSEIHPAQIKEMIADINKDYPFVVEQSKRTKPEKRNFS